MAGEVKVIKSTYTGAPTLHGTTGQLITFLDAVLVNGFNSQTPSSITRVGATATVSATAHGFVSGQVVNVTGCTQTEYNGDFPITVVDANSFTYAVTGSPATPATGSPQVKAAPVGFQKVFSGTNKAAYRSLDIKSSRFYLQVLDDGSVGGSPKWAGVAGYEAMTSVDAGSRRFPLSGTQNPAVFRKSSTADATTHPWCVIGDSRGFYVFVEYSPVSFPGYYMGGYFGDILSDKIGDAFGTLISFSYSSSQTITEASFFDGFPAARGSLAVSGDGKYLARSHTQTGFSVDAGFIAHFAAASDTVCLGQTGTIPYPSTINKGLLVSPVRVITQDVIRGKMPGLYAPLHTRPLPHYQTLNAIDGLTGVTLMAVSVSTQSVQGQCLFDITGPWR